MCIRDRLYGVGEEFVRSGVLETPYEVPFGEPVVRRVGTDVTVLTIGATLYRALEAAEMMSSQYGIEAEVIDARSLVPFNYDMVLESVAKTGKIIIASDACERGSYLNDLARNVTNLAFDDLDAPPVVIGSRNWITPPIELDEFFTPQATWFLDAYHQRIAPIPGYVPVFNFTNVELLRRSKDVYKRQLEKKGIQFALGARAMEIHEDRVIYEQNGETLTALSDFVLLSVGRRPSIENNGFETIQLYTEKGRIVTDRQCRTNIPGVYAIGDVNGKHMLAHVAYREAQEMCIRDSFCYSTSV